MFLITCTLLEYCFELVCYYMTFFIFLLSLVLLSLKLCLLFYLLQFLKCHILYSMLTLVCVDQSYFQLTLMQHLKRTLSLRPLQLICCHHHSAVALSSCRRLVPLDCSRDSHSNILPGCSFVFSRGITFSPKVGVPVPLLFLTSNPSSSPSRRSTSAPLPSLPFPLEVGPLIELGDLRECCKLPQQGPGRAPATHAFCALATQKDGLL